MNLDSFSKEKEMNLHNFVPRLNYNVVCILYSTVAKQKLWHGTNFLFLFHERDKTRF